jgi:hypothetical protein
MNPSEPAVLDDAGLHFVDLTPGAATLDASSAASMPACW